MTRISILLVSTVFLVAAQGVASAAPTFENCESAHNYGENTARFFVSAAMNNANCEPSRIESSENALANSLRHQKIRAQNSEELKVCFFEGLYEGYVATLWSAYDECSRSLPLLSVARAAVAVFEAMQDSMERVDHAAVNTVFAWVFDVWGSNPEACKNYIEEKLAGVPSADRLKAAVCFNQ